MIHQPKWQFHYPVFQVNRWRSNLSPANGSIACRKLRRQWQYCWRSCACRGTKRGNLCIMGRSSGLLLNKSLDGGDTWMDTNIFVSDIRVDGIIIFPASTGAMDFRSPVVISVTVRSGESVCKLDRSEKWADRYWCLVCQINGWGHHWCSPKRVMMIRLAVSNFSPGWRWIRKPALSGSSSMTGGNIQIRTRMYTWQFQGMRGIFSKL